MRSARDCPQHGIERFRFQRFCSVQIVWEYLGPMKIVRITEVSAIQGVR